MRLYDEHGNDVTNRVLYWLRPGNAPSPAVPSPTVTMDGYTWHLPGAPSDIGDVLGPGSCVDGAIPVFSGPTGKIIASSGVVPTNAGLALLDDADAAAQRTTLGLGNVADVAYTSAKVKLTGAYSLSNGDNTIPWDTDSATDSGGNTVAWDDAGYWAVGDPTKLVAAAAGDYDVGYNFTFGGHTPNDARLTIRQNGQDITYDRNSTLSSSVGTTTVRAQAGDYFQLLVSGDSLSGQSVDTATAFWIRRR